MDVAELDYLLSPSGGQLLSAVSAAYDGTNALPVSASMRASYEPTHVAAALSQVALRRQAVTKFGADAARMYFTRDGLEQATHQPWRRHRAERAVASGLGTVLELACGSGPT